MGGEKFMIPTPQKRIADFEKLGFGMFIHWGLYSQLGKGEWIKKIQNIPLEEYKKLKDTFTASDFDAKKIARLSKDAGMKYIVLTTRHHEGFSLYDTRGLNEFDASHSPAGRDLIKEYVVACREEGIVPFFYHTTLDWYVDCYEMNFKEYQRYLRKSIEILCTNYGEIGGFWFDGNWDKPNENWEEEELYFLIRKHQPNAIIVNNSGIHSQGGIGHEEIDSVTFEQGLPKNINCIAMKKYVASEMCQTINNHWGVGSCDFNIKSVPELIETLCYCRKVGANYLLNIGLTATGSVMKIQEATLEELGNWIGIHKEAIYDVKPSTITGQHKNFCVETENNIAYLFIHNLSISGDKNVTLENGGAGVKIFNNIDKKIKSIQWVDNDEQLSFTQDLDKKYASVFATGYSYGIDLVVRIAKMEFES